MGWGLDEILYFFYRYLYIYYIHQYTTEAFASFYIGGDQQTHEITHGGMEANKHITALSMYIRVYYSIQQ